MRKILMLLGVLLLCFTSMFAQEKKYIPYTVKKGESIRKIARKFDVKSKEIYQLNPGIRRRPKANTVLVIPNKNYVEPSLKTLKSTVSHIVQPKETLFGIAKKYNVSQLDLVAANSQIKVDGLKVGMVLQIPEKKVLTPSQLLQKKRDSLSEKYVLHTVVKDDTYYSLTKRYQVSVHQLRSLNPDLKYGLKLGMDLLIKEKPTVSEPVSTSEEKLFVDSIISNRKINVAFLMPFKFSRNDTLNKDELFATRNNLSNIITDFYLGAEIAIDSLRSQGVQIDVSAFDSENNKDTIQQLFDLKAFDSVHVVFGPIYNAHVDYVARKLYNKKIVYPFHSSRQGSFRASNIVKTETDREIFEEKIIRHFKETHTNEHVLIIGDETQKSRLKMDAFAKSLLENDSISDVKILQPQNGYIDKERFVTAVDTLGVNWVLLATNNSVVTADAVNNLKSLPNNPKVKLFAFEKARNFQKIDNNVLASMNFTFATSRVFNDTLPVVSAFYGQYQKKNHTFPSENSLRGFDVVYDYLMRYQSNDESIMYSGNSKRLESSFDYKKSPFLKPTSNNAVYLMKYNEDLSVELIDENKKKEKTPIEAYFEPAF